MSFWIRLNFLKPVHTCVFFFLLSSLEKMLILLFEVRKRSTSSSHWKKKLLCLPSRPAAIPHKKKSMAPPLMNCFANQSSMLDCLAPPSFPAPLLVTRGGVPSPSLPRSSCVPVLLWAAWRNKITFRAATDPKDEEGKKKRTFLNANTSERTGTFCLERDLTADVNTHTAAKRVDGLHYKRTILLLQGSVRTGGWTLLSFQIVWWRWGTTLICVGDSLW